MLIRNIDFNDLYHQQMQRAKRTEKTPEHWDNRAKKMAEESEKKPNDYLQQLLEKMDLSDARSLFDMGCGPGTVALAVADGLECVYGVDYSSGMLAVAARRAAERNMHNIHWVKRAWHEEWQDLPVCDIAVASRSTLVADMQDAMRRLNRQARLRVYTTHLVNSTFMNREILGVLDREVSVLPNYIYAVNVLYQMGIQARVDFIRGPNCQGDSSTFERFCENVIWSSGPLSEQEVQRLYDWYRQRQRSGIAIAPRSRDWALIGWDCVPDEALTLTESR